MSSEERFNKMHKIRLLILMLLMGGGGAYLQTAMHENVHMRNHVTYGCINYTIENYVYRGSFQCHEYNHVLTEVESLNIDQNDILIENIGYHIYSLEFTLLMASWFIGMSIMYPKEIGDEE